jgi:hypothetical protein
MKTPIRLSLAVAAITVIAAAPAFAQEAVGTLQVQQGTVMTSTGGEFASAVSGQVVQAGERLMIGEDGRASVTFANDMVVNYTVPGVYTVQVPVAGSPVASAGGAGTATSIGITAGAAALGAAAIEASGDTVEPDHPVSR